MQNFLIKVYLKVITIPEEGGKFLVLLDDDGHFPNFQLSCNGTIEDQIAICLTEFLYENDFYTVMSTKQFGNIEIKENEVAIYFQFISSSTYSKQGAYTVFEKRSIDLYRLSRNE